VQAAGGGACRLEGFGAQGVPGSSRRSEELRQVAEIAEYLAQGTPERTWARLRGEEAHAHRLSLSRFVWPGQRVEAVIPSSY
jgi:hypothetical protein